jgi:nucleotide-binding universal stress UspA family protein
MGTDTPKVSCCHQIDIIHGFVGDSSFVEMKNKRVPIEKQGNSRASLEKRNVSKHLTGLSRDLEDEQRWKYDDESEARSTNDLIIANAAAKSPIRRILIPIDATQVKAADLKPVLKVAQRFDAEVTLLHCYEIPLSFHYAVGRSAIMDVIVHSDLVRTALLQLCAEVRKFFPSCRSEFTLGSLPVEILRASQRLQSDLIVVPLGLDFGSYSWTTKEIMDELVRKADCPVVGIPFQSEESVVSIRHPEDSIR